jgi:hypothetical protein
MGQANIISWVACYTTKQTMVVMNGMITVRHTLPKYNHSRHHSHKGHHACHPKHVATIISGKADITIENIHAVEVVAAYTYDDDAVESYERKWRLRSDER